MVRTRKAIYVGNQEVQRRYIGNKLIFENLDDMDERDDRDKISGVEIFTNKADNSVVHVEVDGVIGGLNNFDVVSSVGNRNLHLGSMNTNSLDFLSNDEITMPVESGVENGINWFTQKYEPTNIFTISFYVEQTYNNYGSIFSEELKNYEGDVTYAVDFMSQEPVEIGLGYYSGTVILEPNKWTRVYGYATKDTRPLGPTAEYQPNIPVGTKVYWRNYSIYKGHIQNKYSPAPEDVTENDNHPLIDKINLSLSEPLRSVGDVKDRLFRDNDGLWKVERNVHTSGVEILSQEMQDKLNNLRSFQDSNYVYTISNTDISPTLHATFKSKGWYDDYKNTLLK